MAREIYTWTMFYDLSQSIASGEIYTWTIFHDLSQGIASGETYNTLCHDLCQRNDFVRDIYFEFHHDLSQSFAYGANYILSDMCPTLLLTDV
jgi:hypothetical protein